MRFLASLLLCVCCCRGDYPPPVDEHADAQEVRASLRTFLAAHRSGRVDTDEYRNLLVGEGQRRLIEVIQGLAPEADLVRPAAEGRAAARVRVADGHDGERYFYLRRDGGSWKVEAMRGMAMLGFFFGLLERMPAKAAELEEGRYVIANARLVTGNDATLRLWSQQHRSDLDALADAARTEIKAGDWVTTQSDWKHHARLSPWLRQLGLNALCHHENGNVKVSIGGLTDNEVGFLKVQSGEPPTSFSRTGPDDYIWVEPVGEGWFLFRTT